jgi:ABC-2 type transport system permease protein
MLAVFTRELKSYFTNITGFIFMGFFLLLSGVFFTLINLGQSNPQFTATLGNIVFIFLFVIPILTMRLLSEESRQKTDTLLLTNPLSITGIIMGKYLAALAVFLITVVVTIIYPVILSTVGFITVSEIVGGYIGVILLGASFIAVGLFISSLTDNQVIAAVVTFGVLLFMWFLDPVQQIVPPEKVAGIVFLSLVVVGIGVFIYLTIRNIYVSIAELVVGAGIVVLLYFVKPDFYDGLIIKFLQWFSIVSRYSEFNMGLLGISPIVYYISFSATFIFLTVRVIEKRRWK